ncbi:serine/threonine-protein phosphatase [Streptomyces sp. ISL-36]|uniref:PP2C family protein-serine/threonine phosphatase n=1 Tax=Streptomyces sp. ISL-36 TaxID=2819182 RepID=UPI001BE713FB|nr:PP2C family protein-serine/threonine phosphatase [Streptomyces sp. ISL-36]MBT2438587.1 serine/threonine-protein phosphatase [Streptomyces sp. ISL-36]
MPTGGHRHRRRRSWSRPRTQITIGRALPVLVMVVTVATDLLTPERERFDRLLVVAPALAAVTWSVRGTVVIGMIAMVLRGLLGVSRNEPFAPDLLANEVVLATVTAAAVWVSRVRLRYERDLREVTAVAEVVQRVVLRPLPPRLGPVRLHLLYVAAAAKARIGGDFYEAVRVPGAVRLMLGDVQGKGLGAVETASVLLGSFRATVNDAPDLPTLADRLEEGLSRFGAWDPASDAAERFATVVLAEIPDDADVIRLLSCGHPAPLLQHGGRVHPVEFTDPSLPVNLAGLVDARHRVEEVPFAPGDRLLLFTDGVSETRDPDGAFYPLEERMRRWATEPGERLPALLHGDLSAYGADGLDDDVAAMLVERLPGPDSGPDSDSDSGSGSDSGSDSGSGPALALGPPGPSGPPV